MRYLDKRPQVILRTDDGYGVHLIKKHTSGIYNIEGHTPEKAKNHNQNAPSYFFIVDEDFVSDEFKKAGKVFNPKPQGATP